jgi:phosphatidylethanolamine-binding protein (PEBP) family uncharacterized protein
MIPLVVAVVTAGLAGCGGGSEGSTESASTVSTAAVERSSDSGKGSKGTSTSKATAPSEEDGISSDQGASTDVGTQGASSAAGKQGAQITPPKSPPEQAATPKEIAQATVASMALESPSLSSSTGGVAPLSSVYTCDGKDGWPAFAWQGVPEGTVELALFAMNVQPVEEKLFFDWAVAGIDPALSGIEASGLPHGAVVGRNSFGKRGYSICPPPGSPETYMFALYALPKRLSPQPGFDPSAFRQEVLAISGNAGLLPASYGRK